jgi:hypothetical protein
MEDLFGYFLGYGDTDIGLNLTAQIIIALIVAPNLYFLYLDLNTQQVICY